MDRIIFGDNQFFGINHMSEDKAQAQSEHFRDTQTILQTIDFAYDSGIHAFMFNTHDKVADICDHFRAHPQRYADLRLYPSMPYAHKYANAVMENGIAGALNDFVFKNRSAGQVVSTLVRGGLGVITRDLIQIMKLLVDAEMRMFRSLDVKAVFLQNIITDLLLGLRAKTFFVEFAQHVKREYGVEAAFNTMNMPALAQFLAECGIENPIICASINKIGYLMNPGVAEYERVISAKTFRPLAMSILASGGLAPKEAVEYVLGQPNIRAIVFGASSRAHILQMKELIEEGLANHDPR